MSTIEYAKEQLEIAANDLKSESKTANNAYKDFINYMQGDYNTANAEYSKAIKNLAENPTDESFAFVKQKFIDIQRAKQRFDELDRLRRSACDTRTQAQNHYDKWLKIVQSHNIWKTFEAE